MEGFYIAFLSSFFTLIGFSLKNWIQHQFDKKQLSLADRYTEDRLLIEKAEKRAEYLALAHFLEESDSKSEYQRANLLSWQLAFWLPAELYKKVVKSIVNKAESPFSPLIEARKLLRGPESCKLTTDDIAIHYPGIGRTKN